MSKSLGNVIDPFEIVEKHGTDALRYWLLRDMPTFEDGDFTWERFTESYNANLANGLGNLVSRVTKMIEMNEIKYSTDELEKDRSIFWKENTKAKMFVEWMDEYELKKAIDEVWEWIAQADNIIAEKEPYKLIKSNPKEAELILKNLAIQLYRIAFALSPLLPETSEKIKKAVFSCEAIKESLFLRIM